MLAVVLDTSPAAWVAWLDGQGGRREPSAVAAVLNQTVVFMNAYLALRDDNVLAVFASHGHFWSAESPDGLFEGGAGCSAPCSPQAPFTLTLQPAALLEPREPEPCRGARRDRAGQRRQQCEC